VQIADGRGFGVRISESGLTRTRAEASARLLPVGVLLAAIALRVVPLLARYPLHRDEALYGAWARLVASSTDPLLLTAWVDKPPLVIYLLAGSLRLFGTSDLALRVPGMIASVACVALVYGLSRQAYDRRSALLAAILCAASPFAILFAPTAFTDPWLTVWLLASTWAALAAKPFWAGLLLGLAVASKQQGVLAAPLVLCMMAVRSTEEIEAKTRGVRLQTFLVRRVLPALAGFAVIFVPLTYWDSLRWAKRPSFWGRSLDTYGGLRLAGPEVWLSRLAAWASQGSYLYGARYATALILAVGLLPGVLAMRQRWAKNGEPLDFGQRIDLLLLAYLAGYLALHVLVTFQPWDRYLLPVLPLTTILAARGLLTVWRGLGHGRWRAAAQLPVVLGLAGLLAWGSWMGVSGRLPVGSDHGAYDNLDRVVAFVRSRPSNALVYHHSLGWYFDFYLFDAPQERSWWENGWKLADLANRVVHDDPANGAGLRARREQWLVLAGWEDPAAEGISLALGGWGLVLREEQSIYRRDRTRAFTVYQIVPANPAEGAGVRGAGLRPAWASTIP
jgi:4-amino-4-deoxy-L-arabinose transferase-like glycosyltransferase